MEYLIKTIEKRDKKIQAQAKRIKQLKTVINNDNNLAEHHRIIDRLMKSETELNERVEEQLTEIEELKGEIIELLQIISMGE